MRNSLVLAFALFTSLVQVQGQSVERINPRVQSSTQVESRITLPEQISLSYHKRLADSYAIEVLRTLFPKAESRASYQIVAGVRGDRVVRSVEKQIPRRREGYCLSIERGRIVVAGHDERGLFYGVQSLRSLIEQGPNLPLGVITDYPDVPYRGVVEGFYGTPWSHEDRLRQLDFYGRHKLNVYIYGPKDDPYHSVPNWRQPYPEKEAGQLRELVARAHKNGVLFYWAIHPGQDIKWTDEDRDMVIRKFELMYDLGVRAFAVFFDDITGEGTKAEKQAELLNYIDDHFIKPKGDVAPLVMCPTEYNKGWSRIEGGYLPTLGNKLNQGIEVMWTGNTVIATIDKPDMAWINQHIKRKAYIWFNFPVSDYVRDHLLLGPTYGNSLEIADDLSGFLSNPMERAEASKIALYSIADYTWNMRHYDSESSWRAAIADLLPNDAEALTCFASHSSDLGANGHRFRRDESVALTPMLERLWRSRGADAEAHRVVEDELIRLERACDVLLGSRDNPHLIREIGPWLRQGRLLAEYGRQTLRLGQEAAQGQWTAFRQTHQHIRALQQQMYDIDLTENQNPYQPGVRVGSKILRPTIDSLLAYQSERHNALHPDHRLPTGATFLPLGLSSSIEQLRHQPLRHRGHFLDLTPPLEAIRLAPRDTVELYGVHGSVRLSALVMDWGESDLAKSMSLEVKTSQGWVKIPLHQREGRNQISADGLIKQLEIEALKLTWQAEAPRELRLRQLRLTLEAKK